MPPLPRQRDCLKQGPKALAQKHSWFYVVFVMLLFYVAVYTLPEVTQAITRSGLHGTVRVPEQSRIVGLLSNAP